MLLLLLLIIIPASLHLETKSISYMTVLYRPKRVNREQQWWRVYILKLIIYLTFPAGCVLEVHSLVCPMVNYVRLRLYLMNFISYKLVQTNLLPSCLTLHDELVRVKCQERLSRQNSPCYCCCSFRPYAFEYGFFQALIARTGTCSGKYANSGVSFEKKKTINAVISMESSISSPSP